MNCKCKAMMRMVGIALDHPLWWCPNCGRLSGAIMRGPFVDDVNAKEEPAMLKTTLVPDLMAQPEPDERRNV